MKEIVNYMEVLVEENINKLLENEAGCKCEQCKSEIMALALNNLKPQYCTSELGQVISKLESVDCQNEANIIIEVTKAIRIVQANPNHRVID